MESNRIEELGCELAQLLRKQIEALESRSHRTATDIELLEYELRQKKVHQICNQLTQANSV